MTFGTGKQDDDRSRRESWGPEDEPRFLEQVKQFYERAAKKTGIPDDWLALI